MFAPKPFFRLLGKALVASGKLMLRPEIPRDAAAISYFSMIALIPSILVMISLGDALLGWTDLHGTVIQRIVALFPGTLLQSNLKEITKPSTAIVLSCVIVVIWSSSWILTFLENAVNRAWGVAAQRSFWESRLRSIAFMFLGGCSLLLSAAITVFIGAARAGATAHAPSAKASFLISWFSYGIVFSAGLIIAILVFTLVFKWMPHRKIFWREAFAGALGTTIIWEIGAFIFARLVPVFEYQRIYGKMGAAIALFVWVYTSNIIMLFGANFSAQLHSMRTEQALIDSGAVNVKNFRRYPSGY
jgi:membrane protein